MAARSSDTIPAGEPSVVPVVAPKYEQVRQLLMRQIRGRKLPVGDTMPSESELVKRFGVSRVTVRRALQCLERDGIIQSEQGVGHVIRTAEVNPPVGIVFGNHQSELAGAPSYQLIVRKLQHLLVEHGYANRLYMVRAHSSELRSDRDQLIVDIRKRLVRGLIAVAWPCHEAHEERERASEDRELLELIRANRVPLVGWTGAGVPGAVALDYESVGRLGAEHFLDRGVGPIALIVGSDAISEQPDALAGFRAAVQRRGGRVAPEHIVRIRELSQAAGYAAMRRLWSLEDRPRAVVIADDVVARGAMAAVLELGIAVPQQLELAALYIRDTDMFFPKPFVRLEVDEDVAAQQVIGQLLKAIKDPGAPLTPIACQPTVVAPADGAEPAQEVSRLLDD